MLNLCSTTRRRRSSCVCHTRVFPSDCPSWLTARRIVSRDATRTCDDLIGRVGPAERLWTGRGSGPIAVPGQRLLHWVPHLQGGRPGVRWSWRRREKGGGGEGGGGSHYPPPTPAGGGRREGGREEVPGEASLLSSSLLHGALMLTQRVQPFCPQF